jgi:hypothetical protein|tara:strand:+ start:729 stop:836 length:108 start_codon:yes stop_codon:yes gene_type:complete
VDIKVVAKLEEGLVSAAADIFAFDEVTKPASSTSI